MRGDDTPALHPDHHAAPCAAEAARGLGPLDLDVLAHRNVLSMGWDHDTRGSGSGRLSFQKSAAREVHSSTPALEEVRSDGSQDPHRHALIYRNPWRVAQLGASGWKVGTMSFRNIPE